MADLGGGTALAFPLGGSGGISTVVRPWIVNLLPPPNATNVGLLEPVRLSIRDAESCVHLGTLQLDLGYAHRHEDGTRLFDAQPRTKLCATVPQALAFADANISLVAGGVQIEKVTSEPQRSVYFTAVDVAGKTYPSAMLSVQVDPQLQHADLSADPMGAVFGMEIGPRHTGVYVYLINTGTDLSPTTQLRVAGPMVDGVRHPDISSEYNWFGLKRYFLVWNELAQQVELFGERSTLITKLLSIPITDFVPFGAGTYQQGGDTDIVAIYGQEGALGNRCVIRSMALSTDAACPIYGSYRPATYRTRQLSTERVSYVATQDPRTLEMSPWFEPPIELIPNPDPAQVKELLARTSVFRITKNTHNTTAAVYREEPGFFRGTLDTEDGDPSPERSGFRLEAEFFGTNPAQGKDGIAAGMGFMLFDGKKVFALDLFDDGLTRNVGLLKRHGVYNNFTHHIAPITPLDWSSPVRFRLVSDPRRNRLEMFALPDVVNPIITQALADGALLPLAAEFNLDGRMPFLAFGHCLPQMLTRGSFDLYQLHYCDFVQSWEARDGGLYRDPETTNPSFTKTGTGTRTLGSAVLTITGAAGETLYYHRPAHLEYGHGAVIEAHLRVASYKPRSRTGAYVVLDDGVTAFMLSFIETDSGRFACVPLMYGLGDYKELVSLAGLGAELSFRIDWTEFHTYRLERVAGVSLSIYVDDDADPKLVIKDLDRVGLPGSRFPGSPTVAFGHFKDDGAISEWKFLRTCWGAGFEISTRKNLPDADLIEDLFATQALVVAFAQDEDA